MKVSIFASPNFRFPIKLELVNTLMLLSEHHYDQRCRDASRVGGVLYGWKNHVTFCDTDEVTATWNELDLVAKIMENAYYAPEESKRAILLFSSHIFKMFEVTRRTLPTWALELIVED